VTSHRGEGTTLTVSVARERALDERDLTSAVAR